MAKRLVASARCQIVGLCLGLESRRLRRCGERMGLLGVCVCVRACVVKVCEKGFGRMSASWTVGTRIHHNEAPRGRPALRPGAACGPNADILYVHRLNSATPSRNVV